MRKAWIFGLAMAALVGVPLPGQAQGPLLVRDIATSPTYSPGSYASGSGATLSMKSWSEPAASGFACMYSLSTGVLPNRP